MPRKGSRDTQPQGDLGFPAGHKAGEPTAASEDPAPKLGRDTIDFTAVNDGSEGRAAIAAWAEVEYEGRDGVKLVRSEEYGSHLSGRRTVHLEIDAQEVLRPLGVDLGVLGAAQVPVADGPVPGGAQVRRD